MEKHTQKVLNQENLTAIGLKATHARDVILAFIEQANHPVAVDEIMQFLQESSCGTNRVTVYRTLDAFVAKNVVRRLEFGEGKFRYEIFIDDHHHLICTSCGTMHAVSDTFMAAIEKQIEKDRQFVVTHHSLEFFGLCQNCKK